VAQVVPAVAVVDHADGISGPPDLRCKSHFDPGREPAIENMSNRRRTRTTSGPLGPKGYQRETGLLPIV
jgi:hypothetical protein